jgi:hypothetical protein
MGAEPRTAAGRRFAETGANTSMSPEQIGQRVLVIEAEAVAAYKAELAEKVRALPYWVWHEGDPGGGEMWVERAAVLALIEEPE